MFFSFFFLLSREIVDSKCYSLTYEFVCQLLQPVCFHEKIILPCQDFCSEFMNSCANVLPGELRDRIKCSVLKTEADGPGTCISKPGKQMRGFFYRHLLKFLLVLYHFTLEVLIDFCPVQSECLTLNTGSKTQNVEELSLDLIFHNNFW